MAWVRIDDQAPRHHKMLKAGPAANWLWVCGIAHCQSQLTDGFISDEVLPMIGVIGAPRCRRLAEALVAVGLFHRVEGGYQVHDYLDSNDTRDEALAKKATSSDQRRQAGIVSGERRRAERREHELNQTGTAPFNTPATEPLNPAPLNPIPSHPIPKKESKERSLGPPKEPADPNVKLFLQWFPTEYHAKRHGADYLVKWEKDAPLVKTLLKATPLERLQNCARIMLSDKCEDEFIIGSDRGIGVLSAKFNWLSDKYATWEARQKASTS